MREVPRYPSPSYNDPDDRRIVQIIRRSAYPVPEAVNILGVPFDGAVLGRKGAAGGPDAIRQSMGGFSNYNVELGVGLERARIYDIGNLALGEDLTVEEAHTLVESEVSADLAPGSMLAILGGDNSISLPALRATGGKFGKLGLIAIDSHFDLRGRIGGKPTSGSSYGLAVETVPSLDPRRVVEVGIHGFLNSRRYFEKAKKLGITVRTAVDVRREGAEAVAKEAYALASSGADAVYLSVDMDSVDLGQVAGVSAPSAGGIAADELQTMAYEIARNRKVKAADIVELAPNLDPAGGSQRVAASVLMCLVAGFSSRKRTKRISGGTKQHRRAALIRASRSS